MARAAGNAMTVLTRRFGSNDRDAAYAIRRSFKIAVAVASFAASATCCARYAEGDMPDQAMKWREKLPGSLKPSKEPIALIGISLARR